MLVWDEVISPGVVLGTFGIVRGCSNTDAAFVTSLVHISTEGLHFTVEDVVVGEEFLADTLVVAESADEFFPGEDAVSFVVVSGHPRVAVFAFAHFFIRHDGAHTILVPGVVSFGEVSLGEDGVVARLGHPVLHHDVVNTALGTSFLGRMSTVEDRTVEFVVVFFFLGVGVSGRDECDLRAQSGSGAGWCCHTVAGCEIAVGNSHSECGTERSAECQKQEKEVLHPRCMWRWWSFVVKSVLDLFIVAIRDEIVAVIW